MTDNTAHADLAKMCGSLADPHKSGKVDTGRMQYTFLTLGDLLAAVRQAAAIHNFALLQPVCTTDTGHTAVETMLVHSSGEVFRSGPWVMGDAPNPQQAGSWVTYWRRYQLASFVGLAGSDDTDAADVRPMDRQYAQTKPVERAQADPEQDDYYIGPHAAGMVASVKQKGALYAIMSELHVPKERAKEFLDWLMLNVLGSERPAGYILQKGDASKLIEALKGDRGPTLADEFLGVIPG